MLNAAAGTTDSVLRELAPRVVGIVARRFGDFDAAEDAVQEALIAATKHWPSDGIPDDPGAWLVQTASRRLIDQMRNERARRDREALMARREPPPADVPDHDDTLLVLLMCCHPALTPSSAVALTLRAVCGLTTAEIARAFLVPEPTMAQRISRAKQSIKKSGAPFQMPTAEELPDRLLSVLHVLYLMFNEGYTASSGSDLHRPELSDEAIRLARMVHEHVPDDPEVTGLLAMMVLIDARRAARVDADGGLIPLPEQDRSLWDQQLIKEGTAMLADAMRRGAVGEYQLQAAITAVHSRARRADDTDWPQIVALYEALEKLTGNPVVTLNRAVAVAMVRGAAEGLEIVAHVADQLNDNYRLDAVRAHLYDMADDTAAAVENYRRAARRTTNLQELRYLVARAARLRRGR